MRQRQNSSAGLHALRGLLRSSALMDERIGQPRWAPYLRSPIRWTHVTFLFSDHLG